MVRYERCCNVLPCALLSLILYPVARGQNPSTSMQVPPLQWINLTRYISPTNAAPPLKDAVIGYDDTSRNLLIYGGESAQGTKQELTYLLNLDDLTWSSPAYPVNSGEYPPARSAALTGYDSASSYRTSQVVYGGIGSNGEALSDAWEFDYISQFWSSVNISGSPVARYGAVGGNDREVLATTSLSAYPNTFYLAGGIDAETLYPLTDVWQLTITGVLSSNNADDVSGSWENITSISGNSSVIDAGGAVVSQTGQQIVAIGGCSSSVPAEANVSCAGGESYVIDTSTGSITSFSSCPAPRLDGTVVANLNGYSSEFDRQVFLLLGLFNTSLWSDDGGLERGEVDVLDIETGTWSRILPAGDPGANGGTPTYPSPRQGAAGLSFPSTLVGSPRDMAADTIVFGGVDYEGNYLSELWLLRAYNATLTYTNDTSWSGYGSGELGYGLNASGQGVTIEYMTACATAISPEASQSGGTSPGTTPGSTSSTIQYNTSVSHRALSPISIALAMLSVICLRLSSPSISGQTHGHTSLYYVGAVVGIVAYAVGIAGLATSFTTISSTMTYVKRSSTSSDILKTSHGKAGIALFAAFYGFLPLLAAFALCFNRTRPAETGTLGRGDERPRVNSNEKAEKEGLFPPRLNSPFRRSVDGHPPDSRLSASCRRVRSWGGLGSFGGSARRSSESGLDNAGVSPASHRSFEVTNRPVRTRRASGNSLAAFSDPRASGTPRNLSDTSWFDRRPSLTTVGESEFALGPLNHRGNDASTPGTPGVDMTSTSGLVFTGHGPDRPLSMPRPLDCFLHILFHLLLLGLCILSLFALWYRAPPPGFIVFLIGTVLFYCALALLSWFGRPRYSILSVLLTRLRGQAPAVIVSSPSGALSTVGSEVPFPTEAPAHRGPYQHHQPPFRTAPSVDYPASLSHGATDVDDGEEDEDARQRRIEEEMSRREVSIVTVPRRKLFLTNPE